jgi:internalin A
MFMHDRPDRRIAMISFRVIASLGCLVLLAFTATLVHGQEKKAAAKDIDAGTVAAYEKLGAVYIRWIWEPGLQGQFPGSEHPGKGLPGFQFFRNLPAEKLPGVPVPFVLILPNGSTDENMDQLANLKNLAILHLGYPSTVTALGLKKLAGFERIFEIDLSGGEADVAGLKVLAGFKALRSLALTIREPTDALYKELARIKNLEELTLRLDLAGTAIVNLRPSDLKELSALKRLTTLRLTDFLTDKNLEDLRDSGLLYALPNAAAKGGVRPKSADDVTSFYVVGGRMTLAGLKTLTSFKNLASLRFSGFNLQDSLVKELVQFENLTSLDLSHAQSENSLYRTKGVGLDELATLKNFTSLNLRSAGLTPASIRELAALKNLTALDVADTPITDARLKELAGLKKLTSLNLRKTQVTNAGMKELAGFKSLAKLSLAKTRVRDFGVRELSGLKDLTSLDLSDTEVTDAALKELVGLKKLTTLNLLGTRTTDGGIAELQKALPTCKIER